MKRIVWLIVVMGLSFLFSPGFARAQDGMGSDTSSDAHVEQLLSTLNDSLEENKLLRENMASLQEALERMTIENNVSRSRIRNLEKRVEEAEALKENQSSVVKEKNELITELEEEKRDIYSKGINVQKQLENAAYQNELLRSILDKSILEEERDDYKNLIVNLEEKSESAVNNLALTRLENEKIKSELSAVYFRLGNVLFDAKNYRGALAEYQKAIEWNPSDSWTHHNMAIIYDFYLDDHPMAIYHYKKYLDFKPVEEEANKIRERVLNLELLRKVVPEYPLKMDFNEYHTSKRT